MPGPGEVDMLPTLPVLMRLDRKGGACRWRCAVCEAVGCWGAQAAEGWTLQAAQLHALRCSGARR